MAMTITREVHDFSCRRGAKVFRPLFVQCCVHYIYLFGDGLVCCIGDAS